MSILRTPSQSEFWSLLPHLLLREKHPVSLDITFLPLTQTLPSACHPPPPLFPRRHNRKISLCLSFSSKHTLKIYPSKPVYTSHYTIIYSPSKHLTILSNLLCQFKQVFKHSIILSNSSFQTLCHLNTLSFQTLHLSNPLPFQALRHPNPSSFKPFVI